MPDQQKKAGGQAAPQRHLAEVIDIRIARARREARAAVVAQPPKPKRRSPSFWMWLKHQRDRDDPVGDIARDAQNDKCWPRGSPPWRRLRRHLLDKHNPSEAAYDAMHRAYGEWQKAVQP